MLTARFLFTGILFMLLMPAPLLAGGHDYWTYQEYMDTFPRQYRLADNFAEQVRQPAQPWTAPRPSTVRIAMVTPDVQVSDYWWRSKLSLSRRLQEIGLPFTLKSYSFQPSTTLRQQERLLAEALDSNPDYLIFTLNVLRHRVLVEKILARGHPKLILINITTPLKHWGKNQPFFYVGFDHREGTQLLTKAINRMTGPNANYLMLYGGQSYISQARGDEFIHLTASQPGFILRNAFYTDMQREKAKQAVLQSLADDPAIDLIYACTTDIALGAADALKQLGREDDVILNGWGGGSAELDALAQGGLDVTVMRMNDDSGVAMAEAIRLDQEGKREQLPLIYSGDFVVIDRQIPAGELERLKTHAFRYSQ